ncbi:MAG: DUF2815 family protein [Acidobacteria bacterium]|jgi:hypothetical protein|nr:DUF2815 family protein [Acidobacteriota bacterium]
MKLFIEGARLSFAHQLFNAEAMEEGQTKKFGADFILEETTKVYKVTSVDGKNVRTPITAAAAMIEVANETWKGKGKEMLAALESSKKCLRNGDARLSSSGEVYVGYEGKLYFSAKNATRPTILDKDKTPLTEADGKPYSGCYVNASIEIYGMSDMKKKGVHASLKGVQFHSDGESFGGGGVASPDEFDDLGDTGGGAASSTSDNDLF